MARKEEEKVVYYSDEVEEDFSGMNIKKTSLKSDYKYYSTNPFYRFFSKLLCILIVIPLFWCINIIKFRPVYKNKKLFKQVKGKGYYVYSNHTTAFDPTLDGVFFAPLQRTITIASQETFSISSLINPIIRAIGGIPVPNKGDGVMFNNYVKCLSYHVSKKHKIVIYPEAHIWQYYNGVRNFKSGSFRYPVWDNAPIFTLTKTFKKSKWRKTPKIIIYVSGPFYPDTTLPFKEAVNKLRDEAYQSMKENIAKYGSDEIIKYVKKNK